MRVLLVFLGLWFSLSSVCANAVQGFADPLTLPAQNAAYPQRAPMTAITQAGNRQVAVGLRGLIVVSDDAGKTWRQAHVPVSIDLTAVAFPTPDEGWAVGHDGIILHSRDGGLTWVEQMNGVRAAALAVSYYQDKLNAGDASVHSLLDDAKTHQSDNATNPFLSVHFLNASEGYAVGSFGLAMHTLDGGNHWIPCGDKIDNPDDLNLFGLDESGGNVYIASEKGTVFVMAHGTDRFVRHATGYAGSLFGVVGCTNGVLAYGLRGHVYKTTDGGNTWSALSGADGSTLTGAVSRSNGRVVLVDLGGAVLETDAGLSRVSMVKGATGVPLSAVAAGPADQIIVTGVAGLRSLHVR